MVRAFGQVIGAFDDFAAETQNRGVRAEVNFFSLDFKEDGPTSDFLSTLFFA